jgi:hypothetical protein
MERLKKLDEVELLEQLDLTAEELVEAFASEIEENQDKLRSYLGEDNEESRLAD